MKFIRDFMLVIGPISSAFDFLTFYVLLMVLKADQALFQTGWFVESLCTQVLVIFIIRTRGNPFRSRPHRVLAVTSILVAAIGAVLPFTPLGTYFGFVPLPAKFYLILAVMVVIYLVAVEFAKKGFYRWHKRPGSYRGAARASRVGRVT
jgi:Mg2+-importing ATPase